MKHFILIAVLFSFFSASAQTKGYLRYDSTQMEKVGGNNELILLNGSRGILGPLVNLGNGRTKFVSIDSLVPKFRFGIEDNFLIENRAVNGNGAQGFNMSEASEINFSVNTYIGSAAGLQLNATDIPATVNLYNSNGNIAIDDSIRMNPVKLADDTTRNYLLGISQIGAVKKYYFPKNWDAGLSRFGIEDNILGTNRTISDNGTHNFGMYDAQIVGFSVTDGTQTAGIDMTSSSGASSTIYGGLNSIQVKGDSIRVDLVGGNFDKPLGSQDTTGKWLLALTPTLGLQRFYFPSNWNGTGGSGSPAGSNTQIQFNNSGAFGASSNLTWDGSFIGAPGITTGGTSQTVKQVGDTYGESGLRLVNRAGSAGAEFYNSGLDLVDMAFKTSTLNQFNFRYEHRSSEFISSLNTGGEFHLLSGSGTTIWGALGENSNYLKRLKLGAAGTAARELDVAGDAQISGAVKLSNFAGTGDKVLTVNNTGDVGTMVVLAAEFAPTVTAVTNLSAVTLESASYIRTGTIVQVSLNVRATATTGAGAATSFAMDLPFASNFTATSDARGGGGSAAFNSTDKASGSVIVTADGTNDRVNITWNETSTIQHTVGVSFQYTIK